MPRLLRIVAPAGYGKTTLARVLLERAGSSAVCDLAYVTSQRDVVRAAVEAVSRDGDADERRIVADEFLGLGDDHGSWVRFGQRFFRELRRPATLCFENGETIADRPELRAAIQDLLRHANARLRVIICSRVALGLELGRFAGPDATRIVDANDLRFDLEEIQRSFAGAVNQYTQIERIEAYTNGWPIVVMMLRQLSQRGRLAEFLLGKRDESDLYGYLAGEVYGYLTADERELLEALAAIADATDRDLRALFPRSARVLDDLQRRTPFVSRTPANTLEVHPAMREMLGTRGSKHAVLQRLFDALPRDDGGIRAAQIALQMGDMHAAASALVGHEGGYLLTAVTAELNAVLSAIPSEVLADFPELWNMGTLGRAFSRDPVVWIEEGERVYAACTPSTSDTVRGGVAMSLINAYLNRGRWHEAQQFGERLVDEAGDSFRPLAELIAHFWKTAADAYRGRAVDTSLYETRYAPFMANPATRALSEYDVIARDLRLRGERVASRAVLDRAVDVALATEIPLVSTLVVMDAAFGAWFFGEDELYERYLTKLESLVVPSVERGIKLFLMCARGQARRAVLDTEKMKTRAYAFVIAASLEGNRARRLAYLNEAVVASDHADQPFAQVLARTALALTQEGSARTSTFEEAQRIADTTCSQALREAVSRTQDEHAEGTMLAAVARRFAIAREPVRTATAVVDLEVGTVIVDGRNARLSEREAQLVTLLALRGCVHPDKIADLLWPEFDGDRAAASLKTYISRLRRIAGDRSFIVYEPQGYRLGTPARVVRGSAIAGRFARWPWIAAAS